MTVTYRKNTLDLDVPVLHKVVYDYIDDSEPIFSRYRSKDSEVNEWLRQIKKWFVLKKEENDIN